MVNGATTPYAVLTEASGSTPAQPEHWARPHAGALTQGQSAKYTAKLWFAPIPKPVLVFSEKAINSINAT
jgi:hypothetical protein